MQVILKQDVKGSGKAGDLIKVSDGYARNFLLPKGLAVEASTAAVNEKKTRDSAEAYRRETELKEAQRIAEELRDKSITLTAKAGSNGRLFGSVTSKEIAKELNRVYHMELDKKKIVLESEIKAFGTYSFEIKLPQSVNTKMSVKVIEQ